MTDPKKSILEQATDQLGEDKAVLSVTSDRDTLARVDAAVDLGKGFELGGHVEKKAGEKIGWFAGLTKRWGKAKTLALFFALLATPAFAQQPIAVPFPTPGTYQLCWDHDGLNVDGYLIYEGATRLADVRPVRATVTPFYCIPFPALTPGVHTLTAVAYNIAGRAPESDPLVITLVLVPTRVTNLQTRPGP